MVKELAKATNETPNPQPNPMPTLDPQAMIVDTVVGIAREAMTAVTDYLKCKQEQITERKRISATLKAVTAQIEANKEMYIKGLEMYYAEINKLYDTANKAVERALENNDMEMLKCTYNFILTVYSQGNDKLEMLTKQNQIGSNRIMNFIE
jgi:hypothetical protein